jgi:ketosteroid isomerase-like protein
LSSGEPVAIIDRMTPTNTMRRYFDTWNARDFAGFEAQLADDIDFAGPLGTASGPHDCRRGIAGLSEIVDRVEVRAMAADGANVITWFDMHTQAAGTLPVANWATVDDGAIRRVRVTFDPRPLLG